MYSSFTYTFSHLNIKHSIAYDPFQHYLLYTFTWHFGLCYADRHILYFTHDLFLMTENIKAFFSQKFRSWPATMF